MRGQLLPARVVGLLGTLVAVLTMPQSPATASITASPPIKISEENRNLGTVSRPAVGDSVVSIIPAQQLGEVGREERLTSKLEQSGRRKSVNDSKILPPLPKVATHSSSSTRNVGVPSTKDFQFRERLTKQETHQVRPKVEKDTFTPSVPVSFTSFNSFVPSLPPSGARVGYRSGAHGLHLSRVPQPLKQALKHRPSSPPPRPVHIRTQLLNKQHEDETEDYSDSYEERKHLPFPDYDETEKEQQEEYYPPYEKEPLDSSGHYQDNAKEKPRQGDNQGHYGSREEDHAPPDEHNSQFHDYEDDYGDYTYDSDSDEYSYHDQDYDTPFKEEDRYQGPPIYREQYNHRQRYQATPPPAFRASHNQNNHYPSRGTTRSNNAHHIYPPPPPPRPIPSYPPPRHGDGYEEENERGEAEELCKIVKKNGMTCEVCRDGDGGFSEHCSHSSRDSHDEAFSSKHRQSKRDADPSSAPKHTSTTLIRNTSETSPSKSHHGQTSPIQKLQSQSTFSQIDPSFTILNQEMLTHTTGSQPTLSQAANQSKQYEEGYGRRESRAAALMPTVITTATTGAHGNSPFSDSPRLPLDHGRGGASDGSGGGGGGGTGTGVKAQKKQDEEVAGFTFHLDDYDDDDFGFGDTFHDFAFNGDDGGDFDYNFHDFSNPRHHPEPSAEFYQMSAPHYSSAPPLSRHRHPSLRDTHARLEKATDQFMAKDRSLCKKVEKGGMTCYQCPRGRSAVEEECMYASMQPDGHDVRYSEETSYGSSSSTSHPS